MRFSEIASRLTGISTPIGGISWQPSEPEIASARRVVAYLEDRRVLYSPSEMEIPSHCVESVIQIRALLTNEIGKLDSKSELTASLRAMRASCRKFLDSVGWEDSEITWHARNPGHYASWTFYGALGEMRGIFGVHLARIATKFRLDIEDDLASILPAKVEGEKADATGNSKKTKARAARKNRLRKKRDGYEQA